MSYPTSSYTRWAKMSIDFSANFAPQSKFVQNQRKLVENSCQNHLTNVIRCDKLLLVNCPHEHERTQSWKPTTPAPAAENTSV